MPQATKVEWAFASSSIPRLSASCALTSLPVSHKSTIAMRTITRSHVAWLSLWWVLIDFFKKRDIFKPYNYFCGDYFDVRFYFVFVAVSFLVFLTSQSLIYHYHCSS